MSFTVPIFGQNFPLIAPIFLKRSLILPLQLFSSSFIHCSSKKAFFSLCAVLWKLVFSWLYLSISPLLFTSLLYLAIYKVSSDNLFAFLLFFFFGMDLFTASCMILQTSIHNSSGTLATRFNPLNHQAINLHWRKINNRRHADDATLVAESKEELRSLLISMK